MGVIVNDVKNIYLSEHDEQLKMLNPFLQGFDITYAEKKHINNTIIYVFLLKPEQFISDAFGIDKEIMMIFSDYDRIEPRALQAADMLFDVFPFKNRVDSLNFFVVS